MIQYLQESYKFLQRLEYPEHGKRLINTFILLIEFRLTNMSQVDKIKPNISNILKVHFSGTFLLLKSSS